MDPRDANLALRFLLEIAALAALASWGWATHSGVARWAWAIGPPLAAAMVWAVFRVPGEPAEAPVAVPGPVRLVLEWALFAAATAALADAGRRGLAAGLGALVVLHYILDSARVLQLLRAP